MQPKPDPIQVGRKSLLASDSGLGRVSQAGRLWLCPPAWSTLLFEELAAFPVYVNGKGSWPPPA